MLKGLNHHTNSKTLTTVDFERYFKSVNDPESVFYQPDEDISYILMESFLKMS
jgi:hypothetical protein